MNINDEIKALEHRLKELRKQANEKPGDGIPVKEGAWSVLGHGSVCIPMDKQEEFDNVLNRFTSVESAQKHSEMMTMWRQALIDSKNGKPIDINVILPFLEKGFVAMDKSGKWFWYKHEPYCQGENERWAAVNSEWAEIKPFIKLKTVKYWQYSLKRCGL